MIHIEYDKKYDLYRIWSSSKVPVRKANIRYFLGLYGQLSSNFLYPQPRQHRVILVHLNWPKQGITLIFLDEQSKPLIIRHVSNIVERRCQDTDPTRSGRGHRFPQRSDLATEGKPPPPFGTSVHWLQSSLYTLTKSFDHSLTRRERSRPHHHHPPNPRSPLDPLEVSSLPFSNFINLSRTKFGFWGIPEWLIRLPDEVARCFWRVICQ